RIEKKVDGATQVKYVYDGDHIIAEYNNAGTLLRKYVHGPCVDEPICMIEASGTYAGTHYYHYDALGSIVAMTNSSGNVTQLYEYSVYGQVAASDASHPNRFMFTGREFDKDTGLYYYRARYYHPEIGRFLQTDPIGYGDGINWYAYCGNRPGALADPSGMASGFGFRRWTNSGSLSDYYRWPYAEGMEFYWVDDNNNPQSVVCSSIDDWIAWASTGGVYLDMTDDSYKELFPDGWEKGQTGWALAGTCGIAAGEQFGQDWWFWRIKAICWLGLESGIATIESRMAKGQEFHLSLTGGNHNWYDVGTNTLHWNFTLTSMHAGWQEQSPVEVEHKDWMDFHPLAGLAHELRHLYDDSTTRGLPVNPNYNQWRIAENLAMNWENIIRGAISSASPSTVDQHPNRRRYAPYEVWRHWRHVYGYNQF
ncbi:MAG TPA: RHS repeat-associated core domain-containing protein, partial [Candidatus Cryosericum sp.]